MKAIEENTLIDDRYLVVSRVGSGGMADVYCADDQHLGRKVALKILHSRFAQDREFVERFRLEASHAAGLQHPNVVGIFDRGEFDGTYYIAMEYLEGETLKARLAAGLSVPEALRIARQVLAAARYAHKRGVIHRDIKPHNVIVDHEGNAKVADFGIARAGGSEITEVGSIRGTAQYLSPEQAQGKQAEAPSDLYSIGVVIYEMLTGRVPFEADSAVAVALKQVSETPEPPSKLNPDVSPALDAVVMRALEKDPARRFENADEFLTALDRAEANPTAPGEQTARFEPVSEAQLAAASGAGAGEPRQRSWRWIAIVGGIVLIATLGAWLVTRPGTVEVPPVTGQPVGLATQVLEGRGLNVEIRTVRRQTARDTVLEQSPPAGHEVKEGSTIVLTVSAGPGTVEVPKVTGLRERHARERLSELFQVKVEEEFSDRFEEGIAIGTQPEEGVEVPTGSTVTLITSLGVELIAVPDVTGRTREQAEVTLADAGLEARVEERSSTEPEGRVLDQSPLPGTEVERGDRVTIFVSSGEFEIADVVGEREPVAVRRLEAQGLRVSIEETPVASNRRVGQVIEQDPPGGTQVSRGGRVTLTVGSSAEDELQEEEELF